MIKKLSQSSKTCSSVINVITVICIHNHYFHLISYYFFHAPSVFLQLDQMLCTPPALPLALWLFLFLNFLSWRLLLLYPLLSETGVRDQGIAASPHSAVKPGDWREER